MNKKYVFLFATSFSLLLPLIVVMRVKINIHGRQNFWLEVEPYYSFRTIRRKIEYLSGIPRATQIISYNSQEMSEYLVISDCHVVDGDVFDIRLDPELFILRCIEVEGWYYSYAVKPSHTIQQVKTIISEGTSIPPKIQQLTYYGKELKDECRLSDYSIRSSDNAITLQIDYQPIIKDLKRICSVLEEEFLIH